MARHDRTRSLHGRAQIATTAARLMAQDGITDYGMAKRKAARQLGLPENGQMPDNAEVEAELRIYQSLFQDDEQHQHLLELRRIALEIMENLAAFRPYLTGSVLEGTAGEFSSIDLFLFPDSAKEVEIFLLNQGIPFNHAEPRNEKAEAVLVLDCEIADANLVIFPPQLERISFKYRDGRPRDRIRAEALAELLAQSAGND